MEIEDLNDAEEFLKSFAGAEKWLQLQKQWMDFRVKTAPFNNPRFTIGNTDNPLLPWKFMLCTQEYKELAKLAITVLSMATGFCFCFRFFFSFLFSSFFFVIVCANLRHAFFF